MQNSLKIYSINVKETGEKLVFCFVTPFSTVFFNKVYLLFQRGEAGHDVVLDKV